MRERKKIDTIEKGFFVFSEMVYNFHMQDLIMCKKGLIYNEEKRKNKLRYKVKNVFDQMNRLFENLEKNKLLEELKRIEKIVMEYLLKSISYVGERTLERDFKAIGCDASRHYCEDLIEKLERIKKKEIETTKIENLAMKVEISMYISSRKKIKEYCKNKMLKEKAITNRIKRKKCGRMASSTPVYAGAVD